jgi:hypothetical protein
VRVAVEPDVDLASARARLVELDVERAALRERIAVLERDTGAPDITSVVGRVALFASLFRGRTRLRGTLVVVREACFEVAAPKGMVRTLRRIAAASGNCAE